MPAQSKVLPRTPSLTQSLINVGGFAGLWSSFRHLSESVALCLLIMAHCLLPTAAHQLTLATLDMPSLGEGHRVCTDRPVLH